MSSSNRQAPSHQGRLFLSRAFRANVPTATAPLQGLRVLSNFAIVTTHAMSFSLIMLGLSPPVDDVLLARSGFLPTLLVAAMLTVGTFAVDVFFLISGFCLMSAFAKLSGDTGIGPLDKVPFCKHRIPVYVLSRYLRLMPVYVCVAASTYFMGWTSCINLEQFFFTRLAKAQIIRLFRGGHLHPSPGCIIPAWSLEVDFQSQILILLMAALMSSWDSLQNVMLLLTIASGFYRAITWSLGPAIPPPRFPSMRDMLSHTQLLEFSNMTKIEPAAAGVHPSILHARRDAIITFFDWYMDIFSRWGAVLVGAAVWIAMRNKHRFCRTVRIHPLASMVLSGALFAGAIVSLAVIMEGHTLMVFSAAFGFYRILFVFSVSIIIILTCEVGNELPKEANGRLVRTLKNFLGASVFMWLSRSAYVVFLIHPITAFSLTWIWPKLKPETISSQLLVVGAFKWYFVSVLLAIPFCLIEEAGLSLRGKILRRLHLLDSKTSAAVKKNS